MTSPKARRPGFFARFRGTAGELIAYVRNPVLTDSLEPLDRGALDKLSALLLMKLLLMIPIGVGIGFYKSAAETMSGAEIIGPDWSKDFGLALFAAVLVAPILEESLFRGWLRGRAAGLMTIITIIGWVITLYLMTTVSWFDGYRKLAALGATLGWVGLGIYFVRSVIDDNRTPEFFRRNFAWLFWASTSAFALTHIVNYDVDTLWLAVPMTAPQFASGAILGFVRMNYGLRASMAMHAVYNFIIISTIFVLGGLLA